MKIFTITLILFFFFHSYAQENNLLIENVTVIPLHINKLLENKDVVVKDGVIKTIRAHIDTDTLVYNMGRINGQGKFLIPAYSDAHAHFPEEEDLENYFLMNLVNGVTTLRSMRGEMWHLEIDKENRLTPRLKLASPPISRRDSITESSAELFMSNYKLNGFDFVKILSVKNEATFEYLVKSAKSNGLKLAGHCPSNVGIFNVSESGVFESIEHLGGFFQLPNREKINLAINETIGNNVYHCATLDWYYTGQVLEDNLRRRSGVEFLPAKLIEKWENKINSYYSESDEQTRKSDRESSNRKFKSRLGYLGYIYRQGGQLLLSPDASGIYGVPGFGIHTEMRHYSEAGISNFDILKSTCYNLAEMFNDENIWGTIKVGASSDLVLLNENPLDNIENTEKIAGIVFRGEYYTKDELVSKLKALKR